MAQVTPGFNVATGTESGPNMICAFQEGDAQFPCDPGCCTIPAETGSGDGTTGSEEATSGEGTDTSFKFPIWAIILLIVLGALIFAVVIAWAAKKMSRNSRYGNTKG
jgi:hypothetical protein